MGTTGILNGPYTGTSFSSPATAGLAALLLDRYAGDAAYDTPAELARRLTDLATPMADPGSRSPNHRYGAGLAVVPDPAPATVPTVTLTVDAGVLLEGSESAATAWVMATLDRPASSDVAVTLSATPADQVTLSGTTMTIPAGSVHAAPPLTVTAVDDTDEEDDVTVTLSATVSGVAGMVNPTDVTLTIRDDDTPPEVVLPEVVLVGMGARSDIILNQADLGDLASGAFTVAEGGQVLVAAGVRGEWTPQEAGLGNRRELFLDLDTKPGSSVDFELSGTTRYTNWSLALGNVSYLFPPARSPYFTITPTDDDVHSPDRALLVEGEVYPR